MGILAFGGVPALIRARWGGQSLIFFLFFLSITIYSFFLSIPLIAFPDNTIVAGWSFVGAVFTMLFVLLFGTQSAPFKINPFFSVYSRWIRYVLVVLWVPTMYFLIVDFQYPIFNTNGLVFWNANSISTWILTGSASIMAIIFFYLNYTDVALVNEPFSKFKIKILALDGALWAIGIFLYFPSHNVARTISALIIVGFSFISTSIVFSIPRLTHYFKSSGADPVI